MLYGNFRCFLHLTYAFINSRKASYHHLSRTLGCTPLAVPVLDFTGHIRVVGFQLRILCACRTSSSDGFLCANSVGKQW